MHGVMSQSAPRNDYIVRFRSGSGRQVPVPRARPRTVPDTTLNRNQVSGCKDVFHTKATPLYGTEPFLDRFLGEGA